jgi:hypothetical protein
MKLTKYSELPIKEKLVNKIMVYYQTVWAEKKFTALNHKKWLSNFEENERLCCIYLLSKFMFFGQDEIRELLVSLYRDKFKYGIVSAFRKANADTTDLAVIDRGFHDELQRTRFVGLGKASESGSMLLYMFRQVNKLTTGHMKSTGDIFTSGSLSESTVKNYILLDDFCGSGETAIKCNSIIKNIKSINPSIQLSYYVLFATQDGINTVKSHGKFDNVETAFILDSSFKCFEPESRYFTEKYAEIEKVFCKTFAEK